MKKKTVCVQGLSLFAQKKICGDVRQDGIELVTVVQRDDTKEFLFKKVVGKDEKTGQDRENLSLRRKKRADRVL